MYAQTYLRTSISVLQIVELVMALLRYFQATVSLPTAKETALDDTLTQSANAAVPCEDRCKRNGQESVKLTQRLLLSRELPLENMLLSMETQLQ